MMTPKRGSAQGRRYRLSPNVAGPMLARNLASEIGYINLRDLLDPKQSKGLDQLLGDRLMRLIFKAGDRVYPLPHRDSALLILERGTLNVFLDDETERLLVRQLEPDAVFGEMTSLGMRMFGAVVEAAGSARVIVIGKAGVETIQARFPRFLRGWMKAFGPRHSECEALSIISRYGSPRSQVIHDLMRFADDRLVVECTQQEIGDRLGLGRLLVSRVLKDLEREGIISIHRGSIKIKNVERLRDLALF
jgi:CRP-like cAMP-binding protein